MILSLSVICGRPLWILRLRMKVKGGVFVLLGHHSVVENSIYKIFIIRKFNY